MSAGWIGAGNALSIKNTNLILEHCGHQELCRAMIVCATWGRLGEDQWRRLFDRMGFPPAALGRLGAQSARSFFRAFYGRRQSENVSTNDVVVVLEFADRQSGFSVTTGAFELATLDATYGKHLRDRADGEDMADYRSFQFKVECDELRDPRVRARCLGLLESERARVRVAFVRKGDGRTVYFTLREPRYRSFGGGAVVDTVLYPKQPHIARERNADCVEMPLNSVDGPVLNHDQVVNPEERMLLGLVVGEPCFGVSFLDCIFTLRGPDHQNPMQEDAWQLSSYSSALSSVFSSIPRLRKVLRHIFASDDPVG
mmetsp:Transcript_9513/g.28449  ORF Transcript_9513/g.28449 Transcript_9513/m.28449 type:complete len:313 (+) Transcript_9513:129-1067(+)